ncbi:MAG: rhodanese-like domain-containing protein [Crocinitomicaceae bacterium]|nr:rhodanese-like domain-containing protein [Crocinitomicaceae bacterium]
MNVEEISPKEAVDAVSKGAVFVDVREPYELDEVAYGVEYIHIPLGEIQVRLDEFPRDKDIIVGCRSGKRSMNACMFLKMQGYENVRNLEGGIIGWVENECPTK